jgi:hypothetical protein
VDRSTAPQVTEAIYDGKGDAATLLLVVRPHGLDGSHLFPLLRGDKIAPVWVRMLVDPGGARLTRLDEVPVAVDVHVLRVTRNLGMLPDASGSPETVRRRVRALWMAEVRTHGCEGTPELGVTCAALDAALWFFGVWGCAHCEKVGRRLPIAPVCNRCSYGG